MREPVAPHPMTSTRRAPKALGLKTLKCRRGSTAMVDPPARLNVSAMHVQDAGAIVPRVVPGGAGGPRLMHAGNRRRHIFVHRLRDFGLELGLDPGTDAFVNMLVDGPRGVDNLYPGYPEVDCKLHAPELVEDAADKPRTSVFAELLHLFVVLSGRRRSHANMGVSPEEELVGLLDAVGTGVD